MRKNCVGVFLVLFVAMGLAALAIGQTLDVGTGPSPACDKVSGQGCKEEQVPFTAVFKISRVQMLSNGSVITHLSTRIHARDSSGRTAVGTSTDAYSHTSFSIMTVTVNDPVAGTWTSWNSRSRAATVMKLPPLAERHGCWESYTRRFRTSYPAERPSADAASAEAISAEPEAAGDPKPSVTANLKPRIEDLGATTIQGIEAHGTRRTITTPDGGTQTSEIWRSAGLGLVLRSLREEPKKLNETMELESFTKGEPDPMLFEPPDNYDISSEELQQVPCGNQQPGNR